MATDGRALWYRTRPQSMHVHGCVALSHWVESCNALRIRLPYSPHLEALFLYVVVIEVINLCSLLPIQNLGAPALFGSGQVGGKARIKRGQSVAKLWYIQTLTIHSTFYTHWSYPHFISRLSAACLQFGNNLDHISLSIPYPRVSSDYPQYDTKYLFLVCGYKVWTK